MNANAKRTLIASILSIQGGQFVQIEWKRPAKVRKGFEWMGIEKHVKGTVRLGINYDNVADVVKSREEGLLPAQNKGLGWGFYPEGLYPYIMQHKTNGTQYVCLYFSKDNEGNKTGRLQSTWIVGEEEKAISSIRDYLQSSELKSAGQAANTFRPKLDNILYLSCGKITWGKSLKL